MNTQKVHLNKGWMEVYDFGNRKLHAYQTNDLMTDESYILENKDQILLLEFPAFYDNLGEFEQYVSSLEKPIIAKVFSDHPNGATIFSDCKAYASKGTLQSMQTGTIYHLVEGFKTAFHGEFASEFHTITDILEGSKVTIGDFDLEITYHEEDIEIVFPQLQVVYTHMLGHDCHSIVTSNTHADAIIHQLETYKQKGYVLILSSHHTPETLEDVDTKIAYLKDIKEIASHTSNKETFIKVIESKYPTYQGLNYLEMTATAFFPEKA
ncbi:MAG: hypothetical protein ACLU84_01280 [Clostridia bacterium]